MSKLRIKTKKPYIAYPGSLLQNNYGEPLEHGYLLWDIDDADKFNVQYSELPNNAPFVTLDWRGSIDEVITQASSYPDNSRFRVKSTMHVSQKDMSELTSALVSSKQALEVTFKIDNIVNKDMIVTTNDSSIAKSDLRNCNVLCSLLSDYYAHMNVTLNEQEWESTKNIVDLYLSRVNADSVSRNVKWSLKDLKFSNTFGYGEDNKIAFSKLSGITGIFGQNRTGKSSIVGTIMYVLHNDTDRGSIKNIDVVNVRKPYCYARAIIDVNGVSEYVFERQTVKRETKKGVVIANTQLNLFSVNKDGTLTDLNGEQRIDTERLIRDLIGTSDDFLMTTMSVQGDHNNFVSLGSSHRKYVLTKFLDLDVFEKLHEILKSDTASLRAQAKTLSCYADVDAQIVNCASTLETENNNIHVLTAKREQVKNELDDKSKQLSLLRVNKPLTKDALVEQEERVSRLSDALTKGETQIASLNTRLEDASKKLIDLRDLLSRSNVEDLRTKLASINKIESALSLTKNKLSNEEHQLSQLKRSLNILGQVPCNGSFATCTFIKDAVENRDKVSLKDELVQSLKSSLETQQLALASLDKKNLESEIATHEKNVRLASELELAVSRIETDISKVNNSVSIAKHALNAEMSKLELMREETNSDANTVALELRQTISALNIESKSLDAAMLSAAKNIGNLEAKLEKLSHEKTRYDEVHASLKTMELVTNAFSKKGIPTSIINKQLPLINAEIAKILHGIVDFTIELQTDSEDNSMDVYINYGDSKRIIELASGMEKMVSSIAIRVALTNVSSLPKSDMFVVDEGFGALDEGGVEAVNRLLQSLKSQFRNIIVISHVDGVKEIADNVIEITRIEKDSRVCYE